MPDFLAVALKEWELQISEIFAGKTAFLLRKGGILEAENEFLLEYSRFLFFPTVIHQDPRMLKPQFRANVKQTREEPTEVTLRGYAEVARILPVPSRPALESLSDLYIWDNPLLDMRFSYRPEKPLYLVIVRAFQLPTPITLQNTLNYAGCKSWVPLDTPIDISPAQQSLPEQTLQSIVKRVEAAFA